VSYNRKGDSETISWLSLSLNAEKVWISWKQLVYGETQFVLTVSQLAPISSLSLLPTHIDSIAATHEDSIYIFRNDFIHLSCHTVLCDRFDICFWKGRLREETISLIFSQSNHRECWRSNDCWFVSECDQRRTHSHRCRELPLINWFLTCVGWNPWVPTEPFQGFVRNRLNSNYWENICSFTLLITVFQKRTVLNLMVKVLHFLQRGILLTHD